MTTYRMWLRGGTLAVSVHITVDREGDTATAYGFAFDEGVNLRAETKRKTRSTRYSGCCDAEIVYDEIHRLLAGRWGFDSGDIAVTLEQHGLSCTCEDEEGEE